MMGIVYDVRRRANLAIVLAAALLGGLGIPHKSCAGQRALPISKPTPLFVPPAATYTLPPIVVTATRTKITPASSTSYITVFTKKMLSKRQP